MKELDFKEEVVKCCKNLLSEHLDDDEMFKDVLSYSADALDGILLLDFNFSAVHEVLTFYLLNSIQPKEIKEEMAERVNSFVYVAQNISRSYTYLSILNKALFEMTENKTV